MVLCDKTQQKTYYLTETQDT